MSKVNDALKRVRDAQQSAPRPADAPPLRASIPAPAPAPGMGLMPTAFAVATLVGLVSLILLWQVRQKQTAPVATVTPAPTPAPVQIVSITLPKPAPAPSTTPKSTANTPVAAAPVSIPAVPPTPVIKLQGILYSTNNSSAMISGQTVMAGDEVGGYRVAAISQRSVTLVSANRTNILKLGR
jgi:hypothetical protein